MLFLIPIIGRFQSLDLDELVKINDYEFKIGAWVNTSTLVLNFVVSLLKAG